MIKRATLNLGAGVFRVSKPGVDVDVALEDEFLLKEDYFYGQVVETGLVLTPTGGTYTINFLTDVGFMPLVLVWPIMYGLIVRPGVSFNRNGSGNSISYSFVQPSNTQLVITTASNNDSTGLYYQLVRAPKG